MGGGDGGRLCLARVMVHAGCDKQMRTTEMRNTVEMEDIMDSEPAGRLMSDRADVIKVIKLRAGN